jgi:hypothetical protein
VNGQRLDEGAHARRGRLFALGAREHRQRPAPRRLVQTVPRGVAQQIDRVGEVLGGAEPGPALQRPRDYEERDEDQIGWTTGRWTTRRRTIPSTPRR